ncbi:uncharacterized protein I303_105079 [Kwoniella dejecticola CBS 10117]|uniref:SEC7 domain-containing protein n=1 Tax=Kwoniella dejecticola CBS 10117 TaxID=1296121 RepID=A0A1A6A3I3_9TREE|nr:uncharacterized protein I303_05475 [Kwoniella dejecticola CBS 10117]OBR84616.1 hypothetical protein I303_05475 [Kwoniella dejecticola CBS 10117]
MPSSPTKHHFYASRPSSRAGSRPTSPPTSAEVRSQAVAKLKRAASLPRRPDGRRPSLAQAAHSEDDAQIPAYDDRTLNDQQHHHAGPSSISISSPNPSDMQEVLSPSPVNASFDHANIYPSPTPSASTQMQRSVSASSTYHPINTPYYPHTPPPADWAAMQLAQSYLPSLAPTGLSPNPYPHSVPIGVGRNSPSPLPTLGEIASLQRSNSNAARAKAMSKLTGGRDTPQPEEDFTLSTPSRVNLARAGTLGGPKMLDLAILKRNEAVETPTESLAPAAAMLEARPRLQRSFTVSSSNMGEERRSAVGRRMVERLAERRAARQKEEDEVRRLWEERRAQAEAEAEAEALEADRHEQPDDDDHEADEMEHHAEDYHDHSEDHEHSDAEATYDDIPTFSRHSPQERAQETFTPSGGAENLLAATADRPISRGTMVSSQEPFEYESHLRRSLSSRTARGAVGTAEPLPSIVTPDSQYPDVQVIDEILLPPKPAYATPTRPAHGPHDSTSTESTPQGSQSPGGSTLSGLGSMMFVMGGSSVPGTAGVRTQGSGQYWPQEVHEGSEWGTPAKDLHQPTFESPILESPSVTQQPRASSLEGSGEDDESHLTPPSRTTTRTDSMMSWEEVGGKEDQEVRVPTDKTYHQKSGSFSAKLKGSVRSAMKKRSQSRTSITSFTQSPPTSPQIHHPASFSRRGSETSTSPSYHKENSPRHQPSISSLSPSLAPESHSAMLLQHQLSNDPSQVSFLPRATLNDPRVMSAKLSPFPGIVQLERKNSEGGATPTLAEPPKLLHQVSDSAVPSQQRATTPAVPESIYALPLPTNPEDRRASADSATKRNWLSKAFGHSTSPRSSGGLSRKSSSPDIHGENRTLGQGAQIISSDVDPFEPPPLPQNVGVKPSKHRSASPSVSVVPEVSEEGSRYTRFVSMRGENLTPAVPEIPEEQLDQRSKDVLTRMDAVLALGPDDPARPEILDDPPRKLLLSTQVLQVVNTHTVKDRYLFLFNDILVIAKPIITQGIHATLDMKYIVKSIVSLDKLAISGFAEESTNEPQRHPVVTNFIERFAQDPVKACAYLVERSNPKVDTATLASLIFKTPELDKTQVGYLLAHNEKLMRHFIDRFNFHNGRIDEALRMFLLSIRLPTEPTACESLLRGFASRYFEANKSVVSYDQQLATRLVLAIMQLNDSLYGTFGFSLPNHAITQESFISAFRSEDSTNSVPAELLLEIFTSIKQSGLVRSLTSREEADSSRKITMQPRTPSRLTYNVWSEPITISIPSPDRDFKIKLLGEGLECDPSLLDFSTGAEQSFRVKGTNLGIRHLLFNKIGSNSALYGNLGNTRLFTVERAFMKYTFHVSFISHLGVKRKYCFSVNDLETKRRWGKFLSRQIQSTRQSKLSAKNASHADIQAKIRQTAENVSIQVLRDALIPSEHKIQIPPKDFPEEIKNNRASISSVSVRPRAGSVSIAYPPSMKEEANLGPLIPTKSTNTANAGQNNAQVKQPQPQQQSGLMDVQTGKELVLLCRQNSLLPGLLELLHAGKESGQYEEPIQVCEPGKGTGGPLDRGDSVRNKGVRV